MESIVLNCLESKSDVIVDHLLRDCDLIGKFLQADRHPILSGIDNQVGGCLKPVEWKIIYCYLLFATE